MTTTTIRLPEELKDRIASVAEQAGVSPHAFMLEAITEKTEDAERYAAFVREAETRHAEFLKTGMAVSWDDMKAYVRARAAGKSVAPPVARKVTR